MVVQRTNLLMSQWFGTNLESLLRGMLTVMDENLVDYRADYQKQTTLDTAEGRWLDWIGARLGVDRPQRLRDEDSYFGFGPERENVETFDKAPFFTEDERLIGYTGVDDEVYRAILRARAVAVSGSSTMPAIREAAGNVYDRDFLVREGPGTLYVGGSHSVNDYSTVVDSTLRKAFGVPMGVQFINNGFLYRKEPLFSNSITYNTVNTFQSTGFNLQDADLLGRDDGLWLLLGVRERSWAWVKYSYIIGAPVGADAGGLLTDINAAIGRGSSLVTGQNPLMYSDNRTGDYAIRVIPDMRPDATDIANVSLGQSNNLLSTSATVPDDGWLLFRATSEADYVWIRVKDIRALDVATANDTADADNSLLAFKDVTAIYNIYRIGIDANDTLLIAPQVLRADNPTTFDVIHMDVPVRLYDPVDVSYVAHRTFFDTGITMPSSAHRPWLLLNLGGFEGRYRWLRTLDIETKSSAADGDVADGSNSIYFGIGQAPALQLGYSSHRTILIAFTRTGIPADRIIPVTIGIPGA